MPDPTLLERIKEKLKGKKSTSSAGGKCGPSLKKKCPIPMGGGKTKGKSFRRRLRKPPETEQYNESHINPRFLK